MCERFGTLYLNGQPANPGGVYQEGSTVEFVDAVPGFELTWKPIAKHSFMLTTPALLAISWRQLRDLGFVDGKPFQMDGRMFMVRLPRLGVSPPPHAVAPESPQFWGAETFIGFDSQKPEQRCSTAGFNTNSWGCAHPAQQRPDLGFVPVLDEGI